MKVYIVLDDTKAAYDAGGIFRDVFATLEEAEASVGPSDRDLYPIIEEEINTDKEVK